MNVLLIDEDDDFRTRFGSYLAENLNGVVLTSVSSLEQSSCGLESAEKADIILTSSEHRILEELKRAGLTGRVVAFADGDLSGPFVRSDGIRSVCKYQKASSIISSVAELADAAVSVPLPRAKGRLEVIGVGGFSGGCGRTSFALVYARTLWNRLRRTSLILSVEKTGNINDYFRQAGVKSDLNLLLLNFSSGFPISPQRFIAEDEYGVSAFVMPSQAPCDISDLSKEEIDRFIETIAEWGYFDTLILDLNPQMESVNQAFFRAADKVFIMHDHRQGIHESERNWMERIGEQCGVKMAHIMNMTEEHRNSEIFIDEQAVNDEYFVPSYYIPYDSGSFFTKDGVADISMSGHFARSIAAIAERI